MLPIVELIRNACISYVEQEDPTIAHSISFEVAITKDITKADLYTNLPFVLAGKISKNPVAIAMDLQGFLNNCLDNTKVSQIEVSGGYVNFWVVSEVKEDLDSVQHEDFFGKKVVYDYTDPNPMKEFHIGHLMSNTIGESLTRLGELGGAEVRRYSYQGDTGRHIAVTVWGLQFLDAAWPDDEKISVTEKVKHLGAAYVAGNKRLAELKEKGDDSSEYLEAMKQVQAINQQVYDRSDAEINTVYDQGREWSLQKFEELYDILGTKFDHYFFESQSAPVGLEIVKKHQDVFVPGEEGARVFEGEQYGLHTRVFVNKNGLPTYEGKEVGLTRLKLDVWPFDKSYVITANEQNEVFKVTEKAISMIMPEVAGKLFHIGHGMMKLVGQKMSSRTGKIIAGDVLVESMMEAAFEKMKDRPIAEEHKKGIAEAIAVAAIKFTILKQNFRKDIIFDPEKALALEGDSGPYVQYTAVRIKSLLKKIKDSMEKGALHKDEPLTAEAILLQRTMMRFDCVCYQAIDEFAPQHVAQYLIDLAAKFNGFYAHTKIIQSDTENNIYINKHVVDICERVVQILEKGLYILGIKVVEEM